MGALLFPFDRPLWPDNLIERDGGDHAAVSFWHLWMAEELPFMAQQRPWTRAKVIVAGTPEIPHDPAAEIVVAPPPAPVG